MISRRSLLMTAAAAPLAFAQARSAMGVATTSFGMRRPRDTYEFLEYCHSLGAGGIQASLSSLEPPFISKLRARAGQLGMYLEVMSPLPRTESSQFEAIVQAAKEAGAVCLRAACLPGRRYETFNTLDDWKKFVAESKAAIERAVPILERHKLRLALENHKDWTAEEFVGLLRQYRSEYLGVCLDTGNNIALLDDPIELAEALAPYTFSTHIKDMGVAPYEEGFLLSEVPLGEGFVDLKKIVALVRKHHPDTRLTLEMITRNPLKIPCLTEKYWATFPGREAKYLARTLATVQKHKYNGSLPTVDSLDRDARLRLEEGNVRKCLAYSRENLEA